MNLDDHTERLMLYFDGEMSPEEQLEFENHLAGCESCRTALAEMSALREVTDTMKLADLPEAVWEKYWTGVYNRIERSVAWIMFIIGAIILNGYWVYRVITDPGIKSVVGLGTVLMTAGFAVLLLSVFREKRVVNRADRYISEVKR